MSFKLKIIIIVVMISLLIYVFRKIKHSHFSTKYALIGVVADLLVIVATLLVEKLVSFVNLVLLLLLNGEKNCFLEFTFFNKFLSFSLFPLHKILYLMAFVFSIFKKLLK